MKIARTVAVWVLVGLLVLPAGAWAGAVMRPNGTMSVLENGREVRRIQSEMPVPDGLQLLCNGRCLVQMEGVQMVAHDQAVFAVSEGADRWDVTVKSGRLDFAMRSDADLVTFRTPHDMIRFEEAIFSADTGSMVRGSLIVTEKETRLALHEGTLKVASRNGSQVLSPGAEIQLASSEFAPEEGEAVAGEGLSGTTKAALAAGLGTAAIVTGAIVVENMDDDDDDDDVSPSTPNGLQ
jgi:hypothetical protein